MGPWRIINTNKSPMDFLSSGKEMDQVAMEHGSQRNRVSMLSHTQARTTRTRLCCRRREPRRIPSFPLWHDAWAVCVHTGVWRGHGETCFSDVHQPDTEDTLVLAGKGLDSLSIIYYGKERLGDRRRCLVSTRTILRCYPKQNYVLRDSQASV